METTAPMCIVIGCERLSALTDVTRGQFWSYHAHYCSDCYTGLLRGERQDIDPARLVVGLPEATSNGRGTAIFSSTK
jgi:hypothetical protein